MLTALLKPGDRVFVTSMSGESALLLQELKQFPERAREVTFSGVQFPGIDTADYLAVHPTTRLRAFFMSRAVRAGLAEGRAELMALDYQAVVRQLRDEPACDLVIAQLSTPDADGWCSPGLSCDFMPLVWSRAHRRAAHLNPRLPRLHSSFRVHVSELDMAVEADLPPLTLADGTGGELEARIGRHAAELIRDGDTLQFGIGTVAPAIAGALSSHRRLRIHSGMLPSALRVLWDAGSLEPDAQIIGGVVLGDAGFYDFAARLEQLYLADVSHTHRVAVISSIPRFVAINSAVEVDLFGQVNSERSDGTIQAGAGGLPAFAQGALTSTEGRVLICLPSTARGGSVSRIVPVLNDKSLCTLPRHLADAVVTEYGAVQLRGLSLEGRAQALISIAHPDHRDRLVGSWETIRRSV